MSKVKKEKRTVSKGVAHIKSTFNNTIISISDPAGNVIAWSSSGAQGFKGSRKGTPFAAQVAAEVAAKKGIESGMKTVDVFINDPGAGRGGGVRAPAGRRFQYKPYRGCAPPAAQRLQASQEAQGLIERIFRAPLG